MALNYDLINITLQRIDYPFPLLQSLTFQTHHQWWRKWVQHLNLLDTKLNFSSKSFHKTSEQNGSLLIYSNDLILEYSERSWPYFLTSSSQAFQRLLKTFLNQLLPNLSLHLLLSWNIKSCQSSIVFHQSIRADTNFLKILKLVNLLRFDQLHCTKIQILPYRTFITAS